MQCSERIFEKILLGYFVDKLFFLQNVRRQFLTRKYNNFQATSSSLRAYFYDIQTARVLIETH